MCGGETPRRRGGRQRDDPARPSSPRKGPSPRPSAPVRAARPSRAGLPPERVQRIVGTLGRGNGLPQDMMHALHDTVKMYAAMPT